MKASRIGSSDVFNLLQEDIRLLIIDTRSKNTFSKGHIRRSICVSLTKDGKSLKEISGPGTPVWTTGCWWDRHVILILSEPEEEKSVAIERVRLSEKRPFKKIKTTDSSNDITEGINPVVDYLLSENMVRTLKVLLPDKNSEFKDGFNFFCESYPFLITRQTKGPPIPKYPSEILPQLLYLGDMDNAKDEKKLIDLKISHILTIHTDPLPKSNGNGNRSLLFCNLNDESDADIAQYFESCFDFINDAKKKQGRVLIHCGAGVSRSSSMVASFLIKNHDYSAEDAVQFLKQKRSKVCPNEGFLKALKKFAEEEKKEANLAEKNEFDLLQNSLEEEKERKRKRERERERESNGLEEMNESSPSQLTLQVYKDGNFVENLILKSSFKYFFGRLSENDFVLNHASISRKHAVIVLGEERKVFLEDLKSAHGTFLNSKKIISEKPYLLNAADVIRFGESSRNYVVKR